MILAEIRNGWHVYNPPDNTGLVIIVLALIIALVVIFGIIMWSESKKKKETGKNQTQKCTLCHRDAKEHPAKYKLVRWFPPMRDYACEECYWAIKNMNPYLEGRPIKEK